MAERSAEPWRMVTIEMVQEPTRQSIARSGRGKPLTPSQEAALIGICRARRTEQNLNNQTKSFWRTLSSELLMTTGRVYSWQSCRRRMLAWESGLSVPAEVPDPGYAGASPSLRQSQDLSANGEAKDPSRLLNPSLRGNSQSTNARQIDQLPVLHSPSRNQGSFVDGQMAPTVEPRRHHSPIMHDSDIDDETDNESLPEGPIPPLRRNLRTKRETEGDLKHETLATFRDSMNAFEAELQSFTHAVLEAEEDREDVTDAFRSFRERVDTVLERHNRRRHAARR